MFLYHEHTSVHSFIQKIFLGHYLLYTKHRTDKKSSSVSAGYSNYSPPSNRHSGFSFLLLETAVIMEVYLHDLFIQKWKCWVKMFLYFIF